MNPFAELSPPYATIVADPPWDHSDGTGVTWGESPRITGLPYSTMSVEDIAAMPVLDLAAANAWLFLWTTQRYLWEARHVCLSWGFRPVQVLVWCKPPTGWSPGSCFGSSTEFVIYARRYHGAGERLVERAGAVIRAAREAAGITRAELHRLVRGGTPTGIVFRWEDDDSLPNERDWQRLQEVLPTLRGVDRPYVPPPDHKLQLRVDRSWWEWPRTAHSAKPPAFLDIVEQVAPTPRVELFARAPRLGWDSWGYGYESETPTGRQFGGSLA